MNQNRFLESLFKVTLASDIRYSLFISQFYINIFVYISTTLFVYRISLLI